MPRFVSLEAIKEAVTMVQVLALYDHMGQMQRCGTCLIGACPFHDADGKKQLHVDVEANRWRCYGPCKLGGNVLDFVARMEEFSERDAGILLCECFELPLTGFAPDISPIKMKAAGWSSSPIAGS